MCSAVLTLENAVDPVGVGVCHPADGVLHGTTGRDKVTCCVLMQVGGHTLSV